MIDTGLTKEQKYLRIKGLMPEVVATLGLDLKDDRLVETPHRIAKMYINEFLGGLDYEDFPRLSVIENKMKVENMVKVNDISVISTCEHHFVTINGTANVAYIPNKKSLVCLRLID